MNSPNEHEIYEKNWWGKCTNTFSGTRNGASELAVTDSSITTGTRAGFMLNANITTARAQGDSFEAGDLGFFGYPKIIYLMRGA